VQIFFLIHSKEEFQNNF